MMMIASIGSPSYVHPFDSFTAGAFSLSAPMPVLRTPVLDGGIATYRSRPQLIVLMCPLDAQLALLEVHVCPDHARISRAAISASTFSLSPACSLGNSAEVFSLVPECRRVERCQAGPPLKYPALFR
jgi:hypothetical protein